MLNTYLNVIRFTYSILITIRSSFKPRVRIPSEFVAVYTRSLRGTNAVTQRFYGAEIMFVLAVSSAYEAHQEPFSVGFLFFRRRR